MGKARVVIRYKNGLNDYKEKAFSVEANSIHHAQEVALIAAKKVIGSKYPVLLIHDHVVDRHGHHINYDMWVHSVSFV